MTSELLPQCLSVLMSWSDRFDQIVFITVTVLCLGRKLCVKEVKQLSNQWTVTIEKLFALIFLPPPPKQKEKKKIEHVGMRYTFLIIRKLCQMEVYCLDSHTKKKSVLRHLLGRYAFRLCQSWSNKTVSDSKRICLTVSSHRYIRTWTQMSTAEPLGHILTLFPPRLINSMKI